jgi:transcriptional regulator with XRE-family HTH domain
MTNDKCNSYKMTNVIYNIITFVIHIFPKMRERLIEFLKYENKSSAQFAEEIGVQPSGISHILSGRNNPSLDFILKMLEKYPFISTDWLLFGSGSMYKDENMRNLFSAEAKQAEKISNVSVKFTTDQSELNFSPADREETEKKILSEERKKSHEVMKIVWFYDNNSFEEFFPKK